MANWNKYHAKKTTVRGQTFDSKKEATRYAELLLLQRAGVIRDLKRQVKFILIPAKYENGKCLFKEGSYIADFTYRKDGQLVVEDVKGYRRGAAYALFVWKKKEMYDRKGIKVIEV